MANRVYEYTDQDGNVFYSLSRLAMVSVGRRLTISSRVGTHLQNFVNFIRSQAGQKLDEPDDG